MTKPLRMLSSTASTADLNSATRQLEPDLQRKINKNTLSLPVSNDSERAESGTDQIVGHCGMKKNGLQSPVVQIWSRRGHLQTRRGALHELHPSLCACQGPKTGIGVQTLEVQDEEIERT